MQRFLIYFLFCLSGAVALVYESLWSRYLKLFLGHSSYGQIVTLIVFMGGLGLGSFLAARALPRVRHPFLAYARIELIVAVFGFAFHPAYELLSGWFFKHAAGFQVGGTVLSAVIQVGLCLLLTLPFATLLGMTFPLLATGMIRHFRDGGKASLPLLYFGNSLGGAAGILLCSYWLVSAFGTHGALQMAALGNLVVGGGFYVLHRMGLTGEVTIDEEASGPGAAPLLEGTDKAPDPRIALWLFVAAGTGLASFVYEVGWIRLLSLILGSSTHSFDAMISAFILGLACGGLFVKKILHRCHGDLAPVLGVIQVLMGCFAALSLYLYRPLFDAVRDSHALFAKTEQAYPLYSVYKYLLCLALMFPAAFCAGMTLPLITWRLVRDTGRESFTGLVYGWNTIGSIVGAALGGLILIPLLQLKWTIFAGAALDILLGLILLAVSFRASTRTHQNRVFAPLALRGAALALVAVALLPAFWTEFDPGLLASGKFRAATANSPRQPEVIAIRHGRTATISVGRSGDIRYIATNGKSDGALYLGTEKKAIPTVGDEATVAHLAVLPMLTRSGDYDAAVIGMGTGMTAHYLLGDHRLQSLDLIEIEGEVVKLAKHFQPRNERIWSDPRLNLVIDDAKRHFYTKRKQYDLIISEPSNPWVSGVAGLFTKEFYGHLRHFLKPGGVLVQWVHGYEFRDDLLVSIFSALDTFGHFEVYRVPRNSGDFIIVAGEGPVDFINGDELARNSVLREEFARLGAELDEFGPGNFIASSKTLRPILDTYEALANSDYFPYVEQHAESAFYTSNRVQLPTALLHPFSTYADVLEPERMREARSHRNAGPRAEMDPKHQSMAKQAMGLLALPGPDSDWTTIERHVIATTEHCAGLPAWLEEPLVKRLREVIAKGKADPGVAKRHSLLEAICRDDEAAMKTTLPEAMAASDPATRADAFWVRTFLATSLRVGDGKSRELAVREGVGRCPQLKADERTLIQGIVSESAKGKGTGLVQREEP
jgi:predicted membrane-bound spermidine synthase